MRLALHFAILLSCGGAPQPCPRAAVVPACSSATSTAPVTSTMTPKQFLEKIFSEPHADPAWFSAVFSKQVPSSKIDEITQGILASSGRLKAVRPTADATKFEIALEKGSLDATIVVADGKIQGLLLRPGASTASTLSEAIAPLASLPGRTAFSIIANGTSIAQQREGDALAVGSAFKLAVLVELRDQIETKKLSWDRVVKLDQKWKSLPSGMLHEWPAQSPLTIETLASLMISISDNTATDAVMHLVGRSSLAKYGASQLKPFLTTADMFRLKAKGNEALLERFRKATPAQRENMLAEIAKLPLPRAEDHPTAVTAIDIEWFFSPVELCAYMSKVKELPLMSINPGIVKKSDWDRVAFKGGSEPGVISMTTWLEKGAKSYCVSVISNDDQPIDEARFALAYGASLAFLQKSLP